VPFLKYEYLKIKLRVAGHSGAPAAQRAAQRSPILIMYGKEKETHEWIFCWIFSWLSWLAVLLVGAYARRRVAQHSDQMQCNVCIILVL